MPPARAFGHAEAWPTSMADLGDAERFVVWSFRRWLLGLRHNDGGHWNLVRYEFDSQLGAQDGKAALANFARLVRSLQVHARRPVRHHQPCCPCLGADETWVVGLIAACQRGHADLAVCLAARMVGAEGADDLLAAATGLGEAMGAHALRLPLGAGEAAWPHTPQAPAPMPRHDAAQPALALAPSALLGR